MWLPLARPLLGTWPATQAGALTGNQTSDLLVLRRALNPLSHTTQDLLFNFLREKVSIHPVSQGLLTHKHWAILMGTYSYALLSGPLRCAQLGGKLGRVFCLGQGHRCVGERGTQPRWGPPALFSVNCFHDNGRPLFHLLVLARPAAHCLVDISVLEALKSNLL